HQITSEQTGYAQQIQRLGDSMLIMHLLENGQRLLMVVQSLAWLLDIGVPVAQAVEAVGKQSRVSKGPRTFKGLAQVDLRLSVIASCPQEAQIKQTLPFCQPIVSFLGSL